jgi:hypothetical protein
MYREFFSSSGFVGAYSRAVVQFDCFRAMTIADRYDAADRVAISSKKK